MSQGKKSSADACNSGTISIRRENPAASANWDALISKHTGASTFHGAAWARVLSQTYGFNPVYLTASLGDELVSALPLMEVASWLTGRRGISLPFTDECAALGTPGSCLIEEALRMGRTRGWKHVEFRGGDGLFKNARPSIIFFGHKLRLSTDTGALFNQCESSVRRAVHKADKAGLTIEFSHTLEATHDFYTLHCETRKKHGLPPQPFEFFRQIHAHIFAPKRGVIVLARFQGRPIASAIFFHDHSGAIYKFGASNKTGLQLRANNLVMWEAIKWHAQKGISLLRFGRTSATNEGLRRYKSGWGAEEYTIHYYKYDLSKNAVVPEKDKAIAWHNKLFRSLPTTVLKWTGSLLYRHIA